MGNVKSLMHVHNKHLESNSLYLYKYMVNYMVLENDRVMSAAKRAPAE